jgi:DNA-directed RNA polymerase specialized sigma54-like protein
VLRSRSYSSLAWSREAKRELAVVTIGRLTECPASEVRQVLALLHRCDPIGVAARDEAEMVRLQAAWDGAPRIVVDLADRALESFEGEVDYPALSEQFDLSSDELKAVRATIRRYRAHPVARLVLGVDDSSYDLSFFREGPEFVQEAGWRGEVPAEPTEQLEALGRAILARVEPFLRYGLERLEPADRAELADAAGLTFDQVGRVSEGVRVDTPWGILAIRHFVRSSPRMGSLGD